MHRNSLAGADFPPPRAHFFSLAVAYSSTNARWREAVGLTCWSYLRFSSSSFVQAKSTPSAASSHTRRQNPVNPWFVSIILNASTGRSRQRKAKNPYPGLVGARIQYAHQRQPAQSSSKYGLKLLPPEQKM